MNLRQADMMLYGAGSLVWLGVVVWLCVHRRNPLRGATLRPHRLDWPSVMLVVLVFVTAAWVAGWVSPLVTPRGLPEQDAEEIRSALALGVSFLAGAVVCLCLGWTCFQARLRGFGLTKRRVARDFCWAVLTILAVWPVVMGMLWVSERVIVVTLGEEYIKDHPAIGVLENPSLPDWVNVLVIGTAVVLAPLAEEFFFRGILQTKLDSTLKSRWGAIIVASSVFGLVHSEQVAAVVPLLLMGVIVGFVYETTGSLVGPILVHAMFNVKSLLWHQLMVTG